MATIDMTHRKLHFPPRFLPYLEKHRIFELFHECVELLVQMKPRDHVKFLRNVLPCAAMKKDKQRIVFLTPISFDRKTFTELLADCLGIQIINLDLMRFLTKEKRKAEQIEIEVMSESIEEESCICPGEGGEFPGFPLYHPGEGLFEEEKLYYLPEEEEVQGEEQRLEEQKLEEQKVEDEESCICVCPCVEEQRERERKAAEKAGGVAGGVAGDGGGTGQEQEQGEEDSEPCPSRRKRKKDKKICKRHHLGQAFTDIRTESTFYNQGQISQSGETIGDIEFEILGSCEQSAKGWILEDYPLTGEEAKHLNSVGVIPTHAIRIIINEEEEDNDLEYKTTVKNWMAAYKYVPVLEIRMQNRNTEEFISDMCNLLSVMPHRHAPMLPRIVLIGSRGAGVTTQGKKLSRKYGLVHVEYELVIARALQQDDELCKLYKAQLATRPDPELEALILERALVTPKCCNRGWVLTGYPTNIDQMRMLDIIATPPNRVIFIEVPPRECFVRLYYRKVDPCLGDEYKIPETLPSGVNLRETPGLDPETADRLLAHPKNDKKQIVHDIEEYFLKKQEMMLYCGRTASYVNGNQETDRVLEQIEQVIINPSPAQPPRDPLAFNYGIDESYERLKKFRLQPGMFFNNMLLNPPERVSKS